MSRPLLPLLLLAACQAPSDEPRGDDTAADTADTADSADSGDSADTGDSGETGETGDTGETGAGDCATPPVVTVAEKASTVFTVAWTTAVAGQGYVEWGYDKAYGNATLPEPEAGTAHEVVVAGPAPGTTVYWRARLDGSSCEIAGRPVAIAPTYDGPVNVRLNDVGAGYHHGFRVMPVSGDTPHVVVIDDGGRVVWWHPVDDGYTAIHAEFDQDATHVLFLLEDEDRNEDIGGIMRVSLDREDVTFIPLHNSHHSFVQLADGGFLFLQTEPREFEGVDVAGDNVVRVDAAGENPEVLFTTWDHWVPDLFVISQVGGNYYPDWADWTHGNSINLRADGSMLVSFHNVNAFANIDMDGTLRWTLGGKDAPVPGEFTFEGDDDTLFGNQHNPIEVDGGVLMFNNGADMARDHAAAVEYTIDESGRTFSEAWRFDWDERLVVQMEGDVHRYADGNTLINWGQAGYLTEVTRDGEVVWEAEATGSILGFMGLTDRLGGAAR